MFNIFKKTEKYSADDKQLIDQIRSGMGESARVHVNEKSALNLVDVFACVRAIAETTASLPFPVYKRNGRGRDRLRDHSAHQILNVSPDGEMPAMAWREAGLGHLLTWGNWFNEMEFTRGGDPLAVYLLPPNKVTPERSKSGKLEYKVEGSHVRIPADRMLHVAGLGFDGIKGYSPIKMGKSAIELAMQTERFGLSWFRNGSRGQGVIKTPNKLSAEAAAKLRESIEHVHQGSENAHRYMVLEDGIDITQIGIPPEDAQFLGTRQFQLTEICRLFRISPVVVQDLSRSTFSNNEQEMLSFIVHTLRPWCRRIENVINWRLLGNDPEIFAEHLIDGLLRGDKATRDASYAAGRQWGWYSANDVLELENRNGIGEQGDIYVVPANMIDAKRFLEPVAPTAVPATPAEPVDEIPDDEPDETPDEPDQETDDDSGPTPPSDEAVKASLACVQDNVDRMIRREIEAIKNASKKPKEFLGLMDSFFCNHRSIAQRAIAPSVKAYEALTGKSDLIPAILNSLVDSSAEQLLELTGNVSADKLTEAIQEWSENRIDTSNNIIAQLEANEESN